MINNKKNPSNQPIIPKKDTKLLKLLTVLFLPYLALSIGQNGFLALLHFVRAEFGLTRVQVGYYSTSFFISAALLSIFTGSIVDKMGPKKGMLFGIGSMGVLLLLHSLSPSYNYLLLIAFFTGLGFSIITPSATKAVMISSPKKKRAASMGFTQTGFGVGGIVGASLIPFLGEIFGWRMAIQAAAFFVLLMVPFVFRLYNEQNFTKNIIDTSNNILKEENLFKNNFLSLFANKFLFRFCIVGIVFGITEGATLSHFVVFLSEDLDMSKPMVGLIFGTLHLGGMIGLIVWGRFSDYFFHSNRNISVFFIGFSAGIMYLIFGFFLKYLLDNPIIVFILSFLLGFSVLGWTGVYLTSVGEFAGEKKAGITTGFALFLIRIGMLVSPPLFGLIADINRGYQLSWLFFGFIIIDISFLFLIKK
jgi:MFS family permease